MKWDEDLLEDQKVAASHSGSHARLLAGPGTGKTRTLTRRAAYLVAEKHVPPGQILALTFTRAAACELRNRIADILEDQYEELPQVSTLHSFALRQLLRNSKCIDSIPQPLRIADNWEERWIILEDLKAILKETVPNYDIKTVREKFNSLSADWQTLADNVSDPGFTGAWREHRKIFGYTMLSELVYRLKQALVVTGEFSLESNYSHLLVDEYQDLNRCDLAVISDIRDRGAEVFAAGDDDQSIYGFRHAYPEGIRRFDKDYVPSSSLNLGTCIRCDRSIINLVLYVARLDPRRLEKTLEPRNDADEGEVHILGFKNQEPEARDVATICKYLWKVKKYKLEDILILVRSDRNRIFSSVLQDALEAQNVPVAVQVEDTPLNTCEDMSEGTKGKISDGKVFLSILRLLAEGNDSLALRTLLMSCRNIGQKSCSELYNLANENKETFSKTAHKVMAGHGLIPSLGKRISVEMRKIQDILDKHRDRFGALADSSESQDLLDSLRCLAEDVIEDSDNRTEVLQFLETIVKETKSTDHKELLRALSSPMENAEQEQVVGKVNIMTMHKAKGLTASAVIIIAAEDEYIPGEPRGKAAEDDERRLLYVSLSRARHFLAVTYCERRTGRQMHSGRKSGRSRRTLTTFLRGCPVKPNLDGAAFVKKLRRKVVQRAKQ